MVFYDKNNKQMSDGKGFRIILLGPQVESDAASLTEGLEGGYQYFVASSRWNMALYVFTRDTKVFEEKYEMEVLDYLFKHGFNQFWNQPQQIEVGPPPLPV